jgi:hypothetical protein
MLATGVTGAAIATGQGATAAKKRSSFVCRHAPNKFRGPKERRERLVCVSGPTGATGPAGSTGPPGTNATPSPVQEIVIPRTTIPFASGFMTDGGNVQNLAKVGPTWTGCAATPSPPGPEAEAPGGLPTPIPA